MAEERELASREAYVDCQSFINEIKKSKALTFQQKRALYGQAIHGDLEGAWKGYRKLVNVRKED